MMMHRSIESANFRALMKEIGKRDLTLQEVIPALLCRFFKIGKRSRGNQHFRLELVTHWQ